jgi:hypothetical protein
MAATSLILWQEAKEGFVRFDGYHFLLFLTLIPFILIVLVPRVASRGLTWMWTPTAIIVAIALIYIVAGFVPKFGYKPYGAGRVFFDEALALSSGSQRRQIVATSRATMQRAYAVPPSMIRMMRGHSVDVDPWVQNVTWAYPGLEMDPLPVIQDYTAYSTSLDDLDAADLASRAAPHYILRQADARIDTRVQAMDPPLTQIAILCRYHQQEATRAWQLLERSSDRCGRVKFLKAMVKHEGVRLRVPAPHRGTMILARFYVPESLLWNVENVLLKPPSVCLTTVTADGATAKARFVLGTGADLHIVYPPDTLGYAAEFTPPKIVAFALASCATRPRTSSRSSLSAAGLVVKFYSVSVGLGR